MYLFKVHAIIILALVAGSACLIPTGGHCLALKRIEGTKLGSAPPAKAVENKSLNLNLIPEYKKKPAPAKAVDNKSLNLGLMPQPKKKPAPAKAKEAKDCGIMCDHMVGLKVDFFSIKSKSGATDIDLTTIYNPFLYFACQGKWFGYNIMLSAGKGKSALGHHILMENIFDFHYSILKKKYLYLGAGVSFHNWMNVVWSTDQASNGLKQFLLFNTLGVQVTATIQPVKWFNIDFWTAFHFLDIYSLRTRATMQSTVDLTTHAIEGPLFVSMELSLSFVPLSWLAISLSGGLTYFTFEEVETGTATPQRDDISVKNWFFTVGVSLLY